MCGQFATLVLASVCVGATLAVNTCEFKIKNTLVGPVWIGIVGDVGQSTPSNGGFALDPEQEISLYEPNDWSGKLWARTWCASNPKSKIECAGAAPTPPVTLVDFMLRSGLENIDAYEISLLQGFNVPVSITPIDGEGDCKGLACHQDLNDKYPEELRHLLNWSSKTIACHSSCSKFNTDQYCCTGAFSNFYRCNPRNWANN